MGDGRVRVLCADDSIDMTRLLARLLDGEHDLTCVGVLASADELVAEAVRLRADVVVVDLTMPGLDPLEAVGSLGRVLPGVRVLVFSGYDDPATVDAVFASGAWGIVSKSDPPRAVVEAVRRVARGETCFPGGMDGRCGSDR